MTRPRFAAAFALLLAAFVCLSTTAQEAPFIGVVKEKTVEVRSGAGRAYYVVGELAKGDMVRVEKVLFNQTWYQIRVPKGVNSYVSKAFVDAQGDGETGKINADRTEFKAASLRGPGESYRVQGTLSKGDKVTILGEEGNFYKIASPTDSYVFIPAGTLREATKDDLEAAGEGGDTEKPAEKPDPKPEPVEPVKPVDPKPEPVDPKPEPVTPPTVPSAEDGWPTPPKVEVTTPARSEVLKELEMKVLPYFSLPVKQQPLDKMAKAYQDLLALDKLNTVDEQIVTVRLRQIERRQEILDTLKRAETAEKTDLGKTPVPEADELDPLPIRYTAVGVLKPSTVYDGNSLPLLYRLVDAAPSGRTIAYVAPNEEVNIAAMLNQLIGVVGEKTYNSTLKLQIIEITRAVALEAEGTEEAREEKDATEAPAEEASE